MQKEVLSLCSGISHGKLREVIAKYDIKEYKLCKINLKQYIKYVIILCIICSIPGATRFSE
jgi:hypothetical protein